MAKWHISLSGKPENCNAEIRSCPRGSESEHYSSPEEARNAYEKKSINEYNVMGSNSKPYITSPPDNFEENVTLPGDNLTMYSVATINGVVTATEYNGKIIENEHLARQVLEISQMKAAEKNNNSHMPTHESNYGEMTNSRPDKAVTKETRPNHSPNIKSNYNNDVNTNMGTMETPRAKEPMFTPVNQNTNSNNNKAYQEFSKYDNAYYREPDPKQFKETVSLPGDNDTLYRVANVDGVHTATDYSGKIIKDEHLARQILTISKEKADGK